MENNECKVNNERLFSLVQELVVDAGCPTPGAEDCRTKECANHQLFEVQEAEEVNCNYLKEVLKTIGKYLNQ